MFHPRFTITNSILKDVAVIEAAKEMINNASLIPAWERQFREEAMIRQVHHSTHIEGNPLNFTQAQKVINGEANQIIARDRDIQEIINYRNVIKYINEYQIPKIDKSILLKIHQLVVAQIIPDDMAGAFRNEQAVVINNITREIVFEPPTAAHVPALIDQWIEWLNDPEAKDILSPIRAGLSLYELVRIHPFVEGNGRTSRVMALLILYLEGYDMKRFFCLDEYFDRDPESYYDALKSADLTGDQTAWLEYFIHGLAIEFNRVKERVVELSRDHALKSKLGQIALSDRQIKLLKFIEDHTQIANIDWQDLLPGVSDDTILRDLKDLMKKKLVKKRGKTKAAYYVLR